MTKLNKQEAKQRIQQLKKAIVNWNQEYFQNDQTIFPESTRDQLKAELIDLEKQFPEFLTKDSPSQVVGAGLSEKFSKIEHLTPKKSLDDVFSIQELEEFIERVKKFLTPQEEKDLEFTLEPKIDGLNVTVWYKQGILHTALTRGNGLVGESVTHTVKTIQNLPHKLPYKIDLEVTGEVFITKENFQKINQQSQQQYANPRNLAAGSIRQIDPQAAKDRLLSINLYSIGQLNLRNSKLSEPQTQEELFKLFDKLNLPHQDRFSTHKTINSLEKEIQALTKNREEFPYEIDGLVIKVNQFQFRQKLGYKAKTPRYACAYKFPATTKSTKLNQITIQVGRTGSLTPVAELEPIHIDGTTVSRATLHNQDEIDRKDIRVGDTVIVRKAGDIIPEVVEVLTEFRTGKEKKFQVPDSCPVCNYPAQQEEGEVVKRCTNPNCPAKTQGSFEHFISRQGFNIDGLGEKVITQLIHEGLIHSFADIFKLSAKDLLPLPLFKEQKTNNILESIQNSKKIKLANFIYSLGIRNIGIQSARDLSSALFSNQEGESISPKDFGNQILENQLEDIINIDGFGDKTAEIFYDWFLSDENIALLADLTQQGVTIHIPEKKQADSILGGQTFLFTGKLQNFDRNTAKTLVENHGGKNASSVSGKLNFLVIGEKPGSKLKKAEAAGVKVITEEEFLKMIS